MEPRLFDLDLQLLADSILSFIAIGSIIGFIIIVVLIIKILIKILKKLDEK